MYILKGAPILLLVFMVGAEKKIELQDIENDNLESEHEKDSDSGPEARSQNDDVPETSSFQHYKNEYHRYFEAPSQPQEQRYVQQYAVSEAPEHRSSVPASPPYGPPLTAQQATAGYLSNVPMQIYLVPQYYSAPSEQASPQSGVQYQTAPISRGYQSSQPTQTQDNYVEVPSYVAPTGKTYIQQYSQPVAYVSYPQPTIASVQATVAPVLTYQPVVQYPSAIYSQQPSNVYYHNSQYTEPNTVEEVQDNDIESQKHYSTQAAEPYVQLEPEFPRHYNSRAQLRDGYRSGPSELPHPSPLLLQPAPSHLSHLPKALPMYRPPKPVYGTANIPTTHTSNPIDPYGPKRRPTSLLDSYIPSRIQAEYLKRGFAKDPLVLYESLSNGRNFNPPPVIPRHFERGFLPNQMYHTASGAITYGHHKRSSKDEKVPQH